MKIVFLTNQLNYRGTTVAITDYAKHNQFILGNDSVICYSKNHHDNDRVVVSELAKQFKLIDFSDLEKENPDLIYRICSGEISELRDLNEKTVNHAVFQFKNEKITAYISEWLSQSLTDHKVPFVPHIVDLPKPTNDYRSYLGIPKDATVIGRYGGWDTFDIEFVKRYAMNKENVYFLFANTQPFIKRKNVIHIGAFHDLQKKTNFINTCDAMLHARARGESFGLAICEFLFHDKPVFAYNGGQDKNHIQLLKGHGLLYNNSHELDLLINDVKEFNNKNYSKIVDGFSPKEVMKKFNEIFIEGI